MRYRAMLFLLILIACQPAVAAGRLEVVGAWIRSAPPGAMMLAGYATLRNSGDAALTIVGANSDAFGDVSLHETVEADGVARMKALDAIEIAPGASVALVPGGKHLMLMRPGHAIKSGESIKIQFALKSGAGTSADFVVRDAAP
jgi:copper(I)-binding protein